MNKVGSRFCGKRQTHTHTHRQNDYRNPTAHVPRVNECEDSICLGLNYHVKEAEGNSHTVIIINEEWESGSVTAHGQRH